MFRVNEEYERGDLLSFIGSKQSQSGIIWGDKEPRCVIITSGGRHGKRVGYGDFQNSDGSWMYIGQGEKGDQDPTSFGNSLLINGEKSVLLFSTREPNAAEVRQRGNHRKLYRFEGIFEVGSWTFHIPEGGKREGNKLIQYHLIPAENIYGDSELEPTLIAKEPENIYDLRRKIKQNQRKPTKQPRRSVVEYRMRSLEVKQYAILRAKGICENCNQPAPFSTAPGVPFLEVHHIFSLSDDGPDTPENVAAVCPNCHREAHYGQHKERFKAHLAQLIKVKEQSLN